MLTRSLFVAAGIALAAVAPANADWPEKPVRIIVPYAPGASGDNTARAFQDKLSEKFGQQFAVDLFHFEIVPEGHELEEEDAMTVARVTEISSTSQTSFDDAVKVGLERAAKTLHNIKSAWVKDQNVMLENDKISEYKVNMLVTFVLDE